MTNYKYGSIFSIGKEVYILAETGNHAVGLINLKTGQLYNNRIASYGSAIEVSDITGVLQITPSSLKYISPSLAQLIKAKSIKSKPDTDTEYELEDWEDWFNRDLCLISTRFQWQFTSNHETVMLTTPDPLLQSYIDSLELHNSRSTSRIYGDSSAMRISYAIETRLLREKYGHPRQRERVRESPY
jgi:hypothetical protein